MDTAMLHLQIILRVNRPPTGGALSVSPLVGVGLVTNFTLACSGWADPESNLPLAYSFLAVRGGVFPVLRDNVTAASVRVRADTKRCRVVT
jgi:hypothetical protein